jgi:hypothetical protein
MGCPTPTKRVCPDPVPHQGPARGWWPPSLPTPTPPLHGFPCTAWRTKPLLFKKFCYVGAEIKIIIIYFEQIQNLQKTNKITRQQIKLIDLPGVPMLLLCIVRWGKLWRRRMLPRLSKQQRRPQNYSFGNGKAAQQFWPQQAFLLPELRRIQKCRRTTFQEDTRVWTWADWSSFNSRISISETPWNGRIL